MGAMPFLVPRKVVIVIKIPAIIVVNVAVEVVVDTVIRNLPRVGPNIVNQVRVIEVDTRINDADSHL